MKKIAKVIELCNDCEHCVFADNRRETKSTFAICMSGKVEPFLINESQSSDIASYGLAIPKNCPLEDYGKN